MCKLLKSIPGINIVSQSFIEVLSEKMKHFIFIFKCIHLLQESSQQYSRANVGPQGQPKSNMRECWKYESGR